MQVSRTNSCRITKRAPVPRLGRKRHNPDLNHSARWQPLRDTQSTELAHVSSPIYARLRRVGAKWRRRCLPVWMQRRRSTGCKCSCQNCPSDVSWSTQDGTDKDLVEASCFWRVQGIYVSREFLLCAWLLCWV